MSNAFTITITGGIPDPEVREVESGDTVRWESTKGEWVVEFMAKKFFLEPNHWPFKGGQQAILVPQGTGSLWYVAEKNILRKEHHYKIAPRDANGKYGSLGNGARIIIK